jgi:type VI secretion system secreted protein VgrG
MSDTSSRRFSFQITGFQELDVLDFKIVEGLCELFQAELTVASPVGDFRPAEAVGKPASLVIPCEGATRYLNGMVSRFAMGDADKNLTPYHVTVVPKVWPLRHRYDVRIFQDLSVPDIVKAVLQGAAIAQGTDFQLRTHRTYAPRTYCVQYRESDWCFICRLLEDEGIAWFFEHGENEQILVMEDTSTVLPPIIGDPLVPYRADLGALRAREHIRTFRTSVELKTDAVVVRQYDFEKPAVDTLDNASAPSRSGFDMEVYDPAVYLPRGLGDKEYAKLRLEQHRTLGRVGEGTSVCARLAPGGTFKLADHPVQEVNGSYLVVSVEHRGVDRAPGELPTQGDADGYSNRFVCTPAEDLYRPALVTPKPRVYGPQPAVVVGPDGEEIYTDPFGRVKVQFYWDRVGKKNENSSCWVRVSQTYAGDGWGAMALPRVNQEVVVDFIEGDPDAPIIVGRLYHGTNIVPYGLPANKTVTTIKSNSSPGGGGSNELRFEDKKGDEEVYFHAQKDLVGAVEHDRTETVGRDETWHVRRDRSDTVDRDETIKIGRNETIEIDGRRVVSVTKDATETIGGNLALSVSKAGTLSVTNDATVTLDAKLNLTAGGKMTITVNADQAFIVTGGSKETISLDKVVLAQNATFEGQMKATLKGGTEADVQALQVKITGDATADVTSPMTTIGDTMTTIKGSAMVQITGAMIMIG